MKKLSIIITHHNEDMNSIVPFFQSIDLQMGVNWDDVEIMLCDNTAKHFNYPYVLDNLNNIKDRIIYSNSVGPNPGLNRQQGIDCCHGEFFTLFECDDILYDSYSLSYLLKAIDQYKDYDIITFGVSNSFHPHQAIDFSYNNMISGTYGTLCKRQFFIDNDIRNVDIPFDEDIYTSKVLRALKDKKVKNLDKVCYIWCCHEDSTSFSYQNKTIDKLMFRVKCSLAVLEYLNNYFISHQDKINHSIDWEFKQELPYFYWKIQQFYNDCGIQDVSEIEQLIVKTYNTYIINKDFYNNITENSCKNFHIVNNSETFYEWINRLFCVTRGDI